MKPLACLLGRHHYGPWDQEHRYYHRCGHGQWDRTHYDQIIAAEDAERKRRYFQKHAS